MDAEAKTATYEKYLAKFQNNTDSGVMMSNE